jgi:16S rRNA processing protein RimM
MPERDEDNGDDAGSGLVLLGRITGAHGIRGEVKITSFTAAPEDIASYGVLTDGKERHLTIEALRPLKGMSISARIAGIRDRNAAEALKGMELFTERARLPETDEDEWYYADLIGLEASTPEGERLGEIIAVQNFGAGDLLEIRGDEGGRSVLVPFTQAAVPVIDVKGGRVIVDQPEDMDDAPDE